MKNKNEFEHLNKKGLFIAGNIRSGTTILWRALNTSPDVCLLYEPLLFKNASVPDFSHWYRKRMQSYEMGNHKATYPPTPRLDGEDSAFKSLERLAEIYKFVGEKLVFETNVDHKLEDFIPFHMKYFSNSHYFFIVRHPVETIWSIYRRWPDIDIALAYRFWLWSLNTLLHAMTVFKHSHMIIFENLSMKTPLRMAEILNVSLKMPPKMVRRKERQTNIMTMNLPDVINKHFEAGRYCEEIYTRLAENLSEKSFTFREENSAASIMQNIKESLASLDDI